MRTILAGGMIFGLMSLAAARQPATIPDPNAAPQGSEARKAGRGSKGFTAGARLSGDQEVPPNDSEADGRFEIQFNCDFTAARYELKVEADRVLQAHLHCGSAGENGPVVVFLFGLFPGGIDVDGDLAEFTITQANLDAVNSDCMNAVGYQIETLEDLAAAIIVGDVYANVHTVTFTGGEIRGQLEPDRRQPRCVGDFGDDDNGNENGNDNNDGH